MLLINIIFVSIASASYGKESAVPAKVTSSMSIFLSEPAPGIIAYLGFLIALATLFWRVIQYVNERVQKNQDRRKRILTTYWGDHTLNPVFLDPLRNFITNNSERISQELVSVEIKSKNQKNSKLVEKFRDDFKEKKNELISRALILKPAFNETYYKTTNRLDELEDDIVLYLAKISGLQLNQKVKICCYSDAQSECFQAYSDILEYILDDKVFK
ncbi:MAG: hypothetical protein ACD_19C00229G0002 [uncultured bacterium]|nr:MAG: hypothetical protein ACD_19C00229G0002 [uncultured bacterium]